MGHNGDSGGISSGDNRYTSGGCDGSGGRGYSGGGSDVFGVSGNGSGANGDRQWW